jgi:carbonic anhydrase
MGKEQLSFSFHSDISATENLGHTVQVDFKDGSTCISNGKNYTSKQFHFHTPSEHLIDGITYPMEMHIVSTITDSSNTNSQSYLVVGVLFKMGAENKFIKEFLDKIPNEEGKKNELQNGSVKLEDLFTYIPKNEMKSVYTYKGLSPRLLIPNVSNGSFSNMLLKPLKQIMDIEKWKAITPGTYRH